MSDGNGELALKERIGLVEIEVRELGEVFRKDGWVGLGEKLRSIDDSIALNTRTVKELKGMVEMLVGALAPKPNEAKPKKRRPKK